MGNILDGLTSRSERDLPATIIFEVQRQMVVRITRESGDVLWTREGRRGGGGFSGGGASDGW